MSLHCERTSCKRVDTFLMLKPPQNDWFDIRIRFWHTIEWFHFHCGSYTHDLWKSSLRLLYGFYFAEDPGFFLHLESWATFHWNEEGFVSDALSVAVAAKPDLLWIKSIYLLHNNNRWDWSLHFEESKQAFFPLWWHRMTSPAVLSCVSQTSLES